MYKITFNFSGEVFYINALEEECDSLAKTLALSYLKLKSETILLNYPDLAEDLRRNRRFSKLKSDTSELYSVEGVAETDLSALQEFVDSKCSVIDGYLELLKQKKKIEDLITPTAAPSETVDERLDREFNDILDENTGFAGRVRRRLGTDDDMP